MVTLIVDRLRQLGKFRDGRIIYKVPADTPVVGYIAFGVIDRGTNVIQVRPTTICPQNCIFCSVDAGIHSTSRWAEYIVDPEAIIRATKLVVAEKGTDVEILLDTTGDVLTYPYLIDLVKSLRRMNYVKSVALETHGLLLSRRLVDRLAEAGLSRVNLSLETLNQEKARTLYGTPAYDLRRVLETAEYIARETTIDLHVSALWLPGINDKDLVDVINWALRVGAGKKWPPITVQKFIKHKYGRGRGLREVSWNKFWEFVRDLEVNLGTRLRWSMSEWGMHYAKRVNSPLKRGDVVEVRVISRGWLRGEYLGVYQNEALIALSSSHSGLKIGRSYLVEVLSNRDGINLGRALKQL